MDKLNDAAGEKIVSKPVTKKMKKKRKDHSQLGADFVAPDGGFGWFICFAAGCSNLSTYPVVQQFGLIFRERLSILGITSAQITTMINLNQALTCLVGLANGPVFRRYTFRQVSFVGAALVAIGTFFTSFSDTFVKFLITFSILYGAGVGLTQSANSLALNTYFKERRRIVTGISWSCTALGPIIFPQIVTLLLPQFGVQGTVLIFSALALNAICCSLLLQPVRWHTKKKEKKNVEESLIDQPPEIDCHYCQSLKKKSHSLVSSQYLYNVDDYFAPGYEIIDPGTPMLAKANDGWYSSSSAKRSLYGSKMSLASKRMNENDSKRASNQNLIISNRTSYANLGNAAAPDVKQKRTKEIREKIIESPSEDCPSYKSPQDLADPQKALPVTEISFKTIPANPTITVSPSINQQEINDTNQLPIISRQTSEANNPTFISRQISESKYMRDNKSNRSMKSNASQNLRARSNTFNVEREVLNIAKNKLELYVNEANEHVMKCRCVALRKFNKELQMQIDMNENIESHKFTIWEKIFIFFDLDLLKDWTYINIMVGITIANFSELNFSVLTPFVLSEFGLDKSQTAFCMSLLGLTDLGVRFFIPFIAGFIGWENRTFFLFGVMGMAVGRIILAHFHSYHVALVTFLWIGFNKGLRTVFLALCIPSHVPLDRLPSATGLHLLFSGLFYIFMGPVVGFVRDHTNYAITLHCLNITTFICATSWGIEKLIMMRRAKRQQLSESR